MHSLQAIDIAENTRGGERGRPLLIDSHFAKKKETKDPGHSQQDRAMGTQLNQSYIGATTLVVIR